jgi:hypothetical protein
LTGCLCWLVIFLCWRAMLALLAVDAGYALIVGWIDRLPSLARYAD